MIQFSQIPTRALIAPGQALLMGSAGFSIIRALREKRGLESAFFCISMGIFGLAFYNPAIEGLHQLSLLMEQEIQKLGNSHAVKDLVWESIKAAADEPGKNGDRYQVNIPSVVEQIFRTGVWGVATSIGDLFFLLAESFVEVKRDVLLTLVQFLFPLLWGLYPAIPSIGNSIVAYLIEMSLWGPCLYLIQIVVGHVAPQYLHRPGSLGIPIIAIEIVATILILEVPSVVHRLLSGALHPGGESAAIGMVFVGAKAVQAANKSAQAASPNPSKLRSSYRNRRKP